MRVACWRFRLTSIPLVLVDEIHRVEARERLVGRIAVGSMRFDQTITVHEERDESGPHTRLGMKLVSDNRIAVIGELISRIEVQRILIEYVDTTLRQIREHCEAALYSTASASTRSARTSPVPASSEPTRPLPAASFQTASLSRIRSAEPTSAT